MFLVVPSQTESDLSHIVNVWEKPLIHVLNSEECSKRFPRQCPLHDVTRGGVSLTMVSKMENVAAVVLAGGVGKRMEAGK